MDQYSHTGYNTPMPPQNNYMNNGYNQNSYSNNTSQMGYGQDYDHSGGYADYKYEENMKIYKFYNFINIFFILVLLQLLMLPMIHAIKDILKIIGSKVTVLPLNMVWFHKILATELRNMMTDHIIIMVRVSRY